MTNNMRCPPEHVKRLAALDCPIAEIERISGYTKEQIEAILAKPRPLSQWEQEREWIAGHGLGEKS